MPFTVYDWFYGIAQIAAGILAIVAGALCLSMIHHSKRAVLRAWRELLIGLFLLTILQVVGGLRTFGIVPNTGMWSFIVHVLVSGVLAFLIAAIVIQLQINRGWLR